MRNTADPYGGTTELSPINILPFKETINVLICFPRLRRVSTVNYGDGHLAWCTQIVQVQEGISLC